MQPFHEGWVLALVRINFLHYAVYMFLICTAVLAGVSLLTPAVPDSRLSGLTFATTADRTENQPESAMETPGTRGLRTVSLLLTISLAVIVISLWYYFR